MPVKTLLMDAKTSVRAKNIFYDLEFYKGASHQLAPITSLPFVHTARRSYRLSDPVNDSDYVGPSGTDVGSFVNLIT